MSLDETPPNLTDLADGILSGPDWERWLAAHPKEAAEIEVARRVRRLVRQLAGADFALPQDFEMRLMARIREDKTLLDLLDLLLADVGGALIELINVLLSMFPVPPQPAAT